MHVFHTAGVPPSSGKAILENIGCTTNSSAALTNTAAVNASATAGWEAERVDEVTGRGHYRVSEQLASGMSAILTPVCRHRPSPAAAPSLCSSLLIGEGTGYAEAHVALAFGRFVRLLARGGRLKLHWICERPMKTGCLQVFRQSEPGCIT